MTKDHSKLTCAMLWSLTKVRTAALAMWFAWCALAWINMGTRVYRYGWAKGFHTDRWSVDFWVTFVILLVFVGAVLLTTAWAVGMFHNWAVRKYEQDC